jgi:hypothetical protein
LPGQSALTVTASEHGIRVTAIPALRAHGGASHVTVIKLALFCPACLALRSRAMSLASPPVPPRVVLGASVRERWHTRRGEVGIWASSYCSSSTPLAARALGLGSTVCARDRRSTHGQHRRLCDAQPHHPGPGRLAPTRRGGSIQRTAVLLHRWRRGRSGGGSAGDGAGLAGFVDRWRALLCGDRPWRAAGPRRWGAHMVAADARALVQTAGPRIDASP